MPSTHLRQLAARLLSWYDEVHANRDMPWRKTRDPYAIWLSETMLQQTQVATVIPYYEKFLLRFPTIADLAAAPLQEVLTLWAGLGYYRRAKFLHQAAQQILAEHAGQLPPAADLLRSLPGIGRYTAGAIASIAFGLPEPVVDGNVMRVLSRVHAYDGDITQPRNHPFFWKAAEELLLHSPDKRYGDSNQALMELGATICLPPPAQPACLLCPLREHCQAYAQGRQMEFPVKSPRKESPTFHATALVILKTDPKTKTREVLLMQRPAGGIWEHMWEFPAFAHAPAKPSTAKMRPTKSLPLATLSKSLNLALAPATPCGTLIHTLTHRTLEFTVLLSALRDNSSTTSSLPPCPHAPGPYAAARWLPWPLDPGTVPLARVVHKIADLVTTNMAK